MLVTNNKSLTKQGEVATRSSTENVIYLLFRKIIRFNNYWNEIKRLNRNTIEFLSDLWSEYR